MVIDMNNDTCIEELINGLNMGKIAIDHLVDKIENRKLKEIAVHQRKNYDDLKEKIMQTFPHATPCPKPVPDNRSTTDSTSSVHRPQSISPHYRFPATHAGCLEAFILA